MIKNLLSLALLSSMAIGANAYGVDDMIYTRAAKYKVTAANLVTNGELKGASLDGWTATDATAASLSDVFTVLEDGGVSVNAGMNAFTNGMYQVVNISEGGTYVVTLKVRGAEPGYTDLDQVAAGHNYIFAYFNTDGTLSTVGGNKNVELSFGEGGKAIENCYSFTNEDYTEMAFPVEAESEGKIVIDLRGLTAGIEIKDIECHKVQTTFDERIAERRLAWIKAVLGDFKWSSAYPGYDELQENIKALENAIKGNDDSNKATMLNNLESFFFDEFAPANLSNVLNTIDHPAGSGGDFSANWMNWKEKYNKCINDAPNQPWVFNCDRWAHKTAAENSPLQVQWMRGYAYNTWDPQARLTTTLDKGTYRLGITGSGGMMTMNKDRWVRSGAYDNVKIEMILENAEDPTKNDTIFAGALSPSFDKSFMGSFTLDEQKEVTILMHCYQVESPSDIPGIDVNLIDPILYKVLVKGEMTPEEKSYIANVETQIATLENRIKAAEDLVAATQTTQPWGKANLQKGIDEAKKRLAVWKALDQDAILDLYLEDKVTYEATAATFYVDGEYVVKDSTYSQNTLANVIMNAGVRYINNEFINVFNNVNKPLTDMPAAIETAKATLNSAVYSMGDKEAYSKAIDEVKKVYDDIFASTTDATMEADIAKLAKAMQDLNDAGDAFKKSAEMTPVVSFDFENGYEKVTSKNEDQEEIVSYVIKSKENNAQFVFADGEFIDEAADAYTYAVGYQVAKSKSDVVNDGNILVLGHFTNLLELPNEVAPAEDDIFRIDFTLHIPAFGNAPGNPTILVLDEQKDTIGGFSKGTWTSLEYSTFGIDAAQFLPTFHTAVGSGKDELKDCFELKGGSRVDYQLIFDFKKQTMTANVIQYYGGVGVCAVDAITEGTPVEFADSKNLPKYISISGTEKTKNTGRRSSIDNLKIYKYNPTTTGITDVVAASVAKASKAIKAIENGKLVIKTDKGTFNAVGAQIK